jgi:hypothetical protein
MGLASGLGAPIAGVLVAAGGFASLWLGGAAVATGVGVYMLKATQSGPALEAARGVARRLNSLRQGSIRCKARPNVGQSVWNMYARAVDDAAARLRDLRREEWEDLGLGALALGLAVAATQVLPSLAVPLFLGGLAVGARGVRALWHRWTLVERLACDRDAYVISEVRVYAGREATRERRNTLAVLIRHRLEQPGPVFEARISAAAEDLEALVSELDDPELELDPVCAVACARLVSDLEESPLLNPALPPEDLRSHVRQIRAGFRQVGFRPDATGDLVQPGPGSA